MSQITYRGQTFNSETDMPEELRRADQEGKMTSTRLETDVVDLPADKQGSFDKTGERSDEQLSGLVAPAVNPENPAAELDSDITISMLICGALWTLMLITIFFLVVQFLQ